MDNSDEIKKIIDTYVSWLNSAMYRKEDMSICWLDVDTEVSKTLLSYKIRYESFEVFDILRTLPESISINKVFQDIQELRYTLTRDLNKLYYELYLEGGNSSELYYREAIRSCGFRAIYYFNQWDWKNCRAQDDFLSLFQRCILHDFKTYSEVKILVHTYRNDLQKYLTNIVKTPLQLEPKKNLELKSFNFEFEEDALDYEFKKGVKIK